MVKRILLIGCNFAPEPTGIGKYSGEMIEWLVRRGYDCTVLTSYPYYPQWKIQHPYSSNWLWYKKEKMYSNLLGNCTVFRVPTYIPSNPTGLKRMMLELSFFNAAFYQLLRVLFHKRYDVVITVAPSFHSGILGVLYKKIRKAKHIYHIQDLQIEAAESLKMITSKTVLKLLYGIERYIFKNSDLISSISEGMVSRIRAKTPKKVFLFPNWSATDKFHPLKNREELKADFGYEPSDTLVLYSGAIGEKQGLESILHSAKKIGNNPKVKFLICGTGPYKKKLEALAREMKLTNLNFFPLQPLEKFNAFLNMADIHLIIQKAQASDLVMPSKLTTILSVGGFSLTTANSDSSLYTLINKFDMGMVVQAENQEALNRGLEAAIRSERSDIVRSNARKYAEEYLDIDSIMHSFTQELIDKKKAKSVVESSY